MTIHEIKRKSTAIQGVDVEPLPEEYSCYNPVAITILPDTILDDNMDWQQQY